MSMKNVVDCKTIHNDSSPYVLPPNLGCPCATDFDKLNIGDEPSSQAQPKFQADFMLSLALFVFYPATM